MRPRLITLLTDFGLSDHFVGVMKCVIAAIAPDAHVIDISHELRPFAINQARFLLAQSWQYCPAGSVHVVVVDPGVGTARRAIVVQSDGQYFVGPDNGLFSDVIARQGAVVREITNARFVFRERSATFHGRDVFAPVAAHLADGVAFDGVGPVVSDPVRLAGLDATQDADGRWHGEVLHVDHYGNLITNLPSALRDGTLHIGDVRIRGVAANYASAKSDAAIIVAGSGGTLEVAVNRGNAARALGVDAGARVEFRAETRADD